MTPFEKWYEKTGKDPNSEIYWLQRQAWCASLDRVLAITRKQIREMEKEIISAKLETKELKLALAKASSKGVPK